MGLLAHEAVALRVGGGRYTFRTLSLVQVYRAQVSLKVLHEWMHLPKPETTRSVVIDAALADFWAILQPRLLEPREPGLFRRLLNVFLPERLQWRNGCRARRCKLRERHADGAHLDEPGVLVRVAAIYLRQDWSKLKSLLSEFDDQPIGRAQQKGPVEAWRAFMGLCGVAATAYGLNYEQFADLRFEEAADMLIAVARAHRTAREGSSQRANDFLNDMVQKRGLTFVEGDAPVDVVDDPDWLTGEN